MMKRKCFRHNQNTASPGRGVAGFWMGAFLLMFSLGCPNEAPDPDPDPVDTVSTADGGPVVPVEPECVVQEGDCPNACVGGTGILGETCSGTTDCMCGLFCNSGVCSPYEDSFEGCTCEGEVPDYGEVPREPGCDELEDGTTCDDGDKCTVFDVNFHFSCTPPFDFEISDVSCRCT